MRDDRHRLDETDEVYAHSPIDNGNRRKIRILDEVKAGSLFFFPEVTITIQLGRAGVWCVTHTV